MDVGMANHRMARRLLIHAYPQRLLQHLIDLLFRVHPHLLVGLPPLRHRLHTAQPPGEVVDDFATTDHYRFV